MWVTHIIICNQAYFFQDLYDAGVGKNMGTDESEFIRILNTRSYSELKMIFEEYTKLAQESITDSIKKEFSGDMKKGLLAIGE